VDEFVQKGRENYKKLDDITRNSCALDAAKTREDFLKAGRAFEGEVHDYLLISARNMIEKGPQFSGFRKQREAFRELKKQHNQIKKEWAMEHQDVMRAETERKKERGFQR
jgi:hypothetical protein